VYLAKNENLKNVTQWKLFPRKHLEWNN
jgi:hypothetical protein